MPSMSYCMFENTTEEMKQIVDTMEEVPDFTALDLNAYEQDAFFQLVDQCHRVIELAKQLMEREDIAGKSPRSVERFNRLLKEIEFDS